MKVINTPTSWVTGDDDDGDISSWITGDGGGDNVVKAYFRQSNCFAFSWNSDRNLIALGQFLF